MIALIASENGISYMGMTALSSTEICQMSLIKLYLREKLKPTKRYNGWLF